MYVVEHGMAMEPMQGKWASPRLDLWYTDLFCVPEVTSVFFLSCDTVLGDSQEFHQSNQGSLRVCLGTQNCSACNAGESGLILRQGGCLMVFLELRREPGVYFRVTVGMAIQNSCLFSDVMTPV